jgi:glycosyltransferase involved in cell wall biosynthesis
MTVRVVLDARFIGLAGIGRMTDGLWRGLIDVGADVVGLWPTGRPLDYMGAHRPSPAGRHMALKARPFLPAEQLVMPRVLRRIGAQVHHAPNFAVPFLTRVPVVLTVHDLFPYLEPANARSPAAAAVYRVSTPLAIRRARIVVAVSGFAARQVTETFGTPADRLRVVEHGIDHDMWKPPNAEQLSTARARYRLPGDYLLYVGTLKRNKNLPTLLAAHGPEHPPLVLAGPAAAEMVSAGLTPSRGSKVIALGRVSDETLQTLYGGALALVLPSLYEGAGFTPLEAMACGTTVLSSDGGALPDTVGEAGLIVPALDVDRWREALTMISQDDSLRSRLVAAGLDRVKQRSWSDVARQYLAIYREALA